MACNLEENLEKDFLEESVKLKMNENEEDYKEEIPKDHSTPKAKLVPNNRTCKYCGEMFPNYRRCFYHQKTVHEGVWHKCDMCDYVNSVRDSLESIRKRSIIM